MQRLKAHIAFECVIATGCPEKDAMAANRHTIILTTSHHPTKTTHTGSTETKIQQRYVTDYLDKYFSFLASFMHKSRYPRAYPRSEVYLGL
jgi:hypothetical protein